MDLTTEAEHLFHDVAEEKIVKLFLIGLYKQIYIEAEIQIAQLDLDILHVFTIELASYFRISRFFILLVQAVFALFMWQYSSDKKLSFA